MSGPTLGLNLQAVWVSVDDRLPDDGQRVLVFRRPSGRNDDGEPLLVACYDRGEWVDCDGAQVFDVTHWQSLPEAPEHAQ